MSLHSMFSGTKASGNRNTSKNKVEGGGQSAIKHIKNLSNDFMSAA